MWYIPSVISIRFFKLFRFRVFDIYEAINYNFTYDVYFKSEKAVINFQAQCQKSSKDFFLSLAPMKMQFFYDKIILRVGLKFRKGNEIHVS